MELAERQKAALTFLQDTNRLTGVIASITPDGGPHAATIYYFVDDSFTFYFLTASNTQKHINLINNPQASLVIGTGPELTTIQGYGLCSLLEKNSDEEAMAMLHIKKRLSEHDGTWPIFQLEQFEDESIAVFKFTPDTLVLLNLETNGLPVTTSDILTILE